MDYQWNQRFGLLARLEGTASQVAEKLRMNGERAKIGGWKTISRASWIVPGASWRNPFFALSEKLSFSAACSAVP
jgi:hypothetical protein